MKEPSKR